MILAMEYIARNINHEGIFDLWLMEGVADGDIQYGDFDATNEDLDYYIEDDKTFADIMGTFLACMMLAAKEGNGGLYCNGVVTKDGDE